MSGPEASTSTGGALVYAGDASGGECAQGDQVHPVPVGGEDVKAPSCMVSLASSSTGDLACQYNGSNERFSAFGILRANYELLATDDQLTTTRQLLTTTCYCLPTTNYYPPAAVYLLLTTVYLLLLSTYYLLLTTTYY